MSKQINRIEDLLIEAGYSTDLSMDDVTGQWTMELTKGPHGFCIDRDTTLEDFGKYLNWHPTWEEDND